MLKAKIQSAAPSWIGVALLCCGQAGAANYAGQDSPAQVRAAQTQTLSVPVAGYVATGSPRTLRPILGTPGALVIGEAMPGIQAHDFLAVSPAQNLILIGDPGAGLKWAPLGPDGIGAEKAIPGGLAGASLAAFNPSGSVAAIGSAGSRNVQVITGLGDSPQVSFEFAIPANEGALRSLAVSEDGQTVVTGTSDGHSGFVRLARKGVDSSLLVQAGDPAVIRFLDRAGQLLVADPVRNQATLFNISQPDAETRVFPGLDRENSGALDDAWLSKDGRALLLIHSGASLIQAIDLTNGAATVSSFPPAALDAGRLAGSEMSVRTSPDGQAVWLVEFNGVEPVSRYIPPLPPAGSASVQEVVK